MKCKDKIIISSETDIFIGECELIKHHIGRHQAKGISDCGRAFYLVWENIPSKGVCFYCEEEKGEYICKVCNVLVCRGCFNQKTKKCRKCSLKILKK